MDIEAEIGGGALMKIKELMGSGVEALETGATLEQAAQLMADADVGSLPVVREGRPVGIITDRDIVVRAVAEGLPPAATKVEDVMTSDLVSCGENDDDRKAAAIMAANRVRRLVVVDGSGRLAGMVALADLAAGTSGIAEKVLAAVSQPSAKLAPGIHADGPVNVDLPEGWDAG